MHLDELLLYLARGALTVFEVLVDHLDRADLKALRYISHEVGDILAPYLFDQSDEIFISAYGPDLNIAYAVLANPLLRCYVRKVVWDYSILDHGLLRYAWYDTDWERISNEDWQGLCSFIHDHAYIVARGYDVEILEQAFLSLPRLVSVRVVHGIRYESVGPTRITFSRQPLVKSPTSIMFNNRSYVIDLMKPAIPSPSRHELEGAGALFQDHPTEPSHFRNLVYRGTGEVPDCCHWMGKALSERVTALLIAMSQAPDLKLQEFIVESSKDSECGKSEAWARAFRKCPRETLTEWISRFASVERLRLFMDDGGHLQTRAIDSLRLQRHFRAILQIACNLEDLQVTGLEFDVMSMLQTTMPQLRRLFMGQVDLKYESLTEFCQRHAVSLRVLDIRTARLSGGSWRQFLTALVDGTPLPLDEISLQAPSTIRDQTFDIRLHRVRNDEIPYRQQIIRCVFRKLISRFGEMMKVCLQPKEGTIHEKDLLRWLCGIPRDLCRAHQDEDTGWMTHEMTIAQMVGMLKLADYK